MLHQVPDMRNAADLLLKQALDATDYAHPFTSSDLQAFCYTLCSKIKEIASLGALRHTPESLTEAYERIAKITCKPIIEIVKLKGGVDLSNWVPPTVIFSVVNGVSFSLALPF